MWNRGLRKEKDIIVLVIVFVVLGVMVTLIANQCNFFSCFAPETGDQSLLDNFEAQ